MGRILGAIATILILLLAAAFALPTFVNWEDYRGVIDEAASDALGRQVRTLGAIEITILPEPRIHLGKIAISNYGKAKKGAAPLLTAEEADIALSLQALLGGVYEAERVRLIRPVLSADLPDNASAGQEGDAVARLMANPKAVHSLEVVDGRISLSAAGSGKNKPFLLDKIDGTFFAPSQGDAYRFAGRISRNGQAFELKFLAAPGAKQELKLSATLSDPSSKSSLQAEGVVVARSGPVFEGTLSATGGANPLSSSGLGVELQAKAAARVDQDGAAFSDLALTIDPQNRPQILIGSGNVDFANQSAAFNLEARSFDADALLASASRGGGAEAGGLPDWASVRDAGEHLLWLYPSAALRLTLSADQAQLRGELLENVKLDAQRSGGRWTFEKVLALLPGETSLRLGGTLSQTPPNDAGRRSQLAGLVSLEGKHLGRLIRWIAPAAPGAAPLPPRPFAFNASAAISSDSFVLEGVKGNLAGTPFNGSLRFEKAPAKRLSLALSGDAFDLSGFDIGQPGAGDLSSGGLTAAWEGKLASLLPFLKDDLQNLDAADLDLSVNSLKTSMFDARNLAARVKLTQDALTVSKLTMETAEGAVLSGEGMVPFKEKGRGKLAGHIEAHSADALKQIAWLGGLGPDFLGDRQLEDFAPASVAVSYETGAVNGEAVIQASGTFGVTRFQARTQLKGGLAGWRGGAMSAQLDAAAVDGGRLLAQLLPVRGAAASSGAAQGLANQPGSLSVRLNGQAQRLETSVALKAGVMQLQLDGVTAYNDGKLAFKGRGSAASPAPELFAPPSLLALIGGEPHANLKVESSLEISANRLAAEKLKAESPQNIVTGRILLDYAGDAPKLDADLKAESFSLPVLMGYFLTPPAEPAQPQVISANAAASAQPEIWTNRPFSLQTFQSASAKLSLAAKSLKLDDSLVLAPGQAAARLEGGRFELQKLEGKISGADFSASGALSAQGNALAASGRVLLANLDLAAASAVEKQPLLSGKASLALSVSGQAFSPRGLLSVLKGRGAIAVSDGQIYKLSPHAVQRAADELAASQTPPTGEVISKRLLEAVQTADFKFRRLKIPVIVNDGLLEVRRASFRGREGTIRVQAYLDLAKMQADSTWQIGVPSDRKAKWPPVKLLMAGPIRSFGASPRSVSAEDFSRAVLVKNMERGINQLEGLNRPQQAPTPWTTTQEPSFKARPPKQQTPSGARDKGDPAGAAANPFPAAQTKSPFEARARELLRSLDGEGAQ